MGDVVTGPGLAVMAQKMVEAINSGKAPVIRDSWALMSEIKAREACDGAMKTMSEILDNWRQHNVKAKPSKLRSGLLKIKSDGLENMIKNFPNGKLNPSTQPLFEQTKSFMDSLSSSFMESVVDKYKEEVSRAKDNIKVRLSSLSSDHQNIENAEDLASHWSAEVDRSLRDATNALCDRLGKETVEDAQNVEEGWMAPFHAGTLPLVTKCFSQMLKTMATSEALMSCSEKLNLEKSLTDVRGELTAAQQELARFKEEALRYSAEATEKHENKLTSMKEQTDNLQSRLDAADANSREATGLLEEERQTTRAQAAELRDLRSSVEALRASGLTAEQNEVVNETLKVENASLKDQVDEMRHEISSCRAKWKRVPTT